MRKILILLLGLAACQTPPPPPPKPDPDARRKQVIALLSALDNGFYSHWGSVESTREYAALQESDAPVLREIADSNGDQALTALRVLGKLAPRERFSPAAKAILYWTVFARDALYNRWGLLSRSGFLPGIYGQEVLDLGAAAVPYFQQSLRDERRVGVFGTAEARASRIQQDRVCDYAWAILSTMVGRPMDYVEDPRLRDLQIHDLDLWLDRRKK